MKRIRYILLFLALHGHADRDICTLSSVILRVMDSNRVSPAEFHIFSSPDF